jgi:hypothetical protein
MDASAEKFMEVLKSNLTKVTDAFISSQRERLIQRLEKEKLAHVG